MKKAVFIALLFSIGSFFFSCNETPSGLHNETVTKKHVPPDFFFLQRNGAIEFDLETYKNGLQQVKQKIQSKGTTGLFDDEWTVQGPGNIGARINTVAVDPTDENIIYAGFSTGGIFKTTNGGEDWVPIFDEEITTSIGDIVIDPNDHQTIYAGTGDPNITGYPFLGNGIYKSTDGGVHWTHLGLEEGRIVTKIIVDPTNSNIIYVSCMGLPMERNSDRGLYKTVDGGAHWEKVLYISDQAGITDMVMDPNNSNVLIAAGWDRIRNNRESILTGQGAKLYKTTDGGENWSILENGLPQEDLCRIGLAIYPSVPAKVYAIVMDTTYNVEGLYRSDDIGESWSSLNTDGLADSFGGFGWYFGKITVNPNNPDDISVLSIDLYRTLDNGETWFEATPPWWEYSVHADKHDMVFTQSGNILLATDGGLYKSDDNGDSWTDIEDIPTNQLYRIAYNPHYPDTYFGGMQDNGTASGNAANISNWERLYGGDGFQPRFDKNIADHNYYETQRGNIVEVLPDGGLNEVTESLSGNDRRNWDMPYLLTYYNVEGDIGNLVYCGTYRVYSYFEYEWTPISEDLTDGVVYGEKFHNITALAATEEEPVMMIAGTSDGNVWQKAKETTNWTRIDDFDNDLVISDVFISPTDENRIYVAQAGYMSNDFSPHLYRSDNLGVDWTDISGDLPVLSVNAIFVVPETEDKVIFIANDGGVYGTLDAGLHWERVGNGMPIVPVFDLDYNVINNELIAGTYGRSIMTYPLNNIIVGIHENKSTAAFSVNNEVSISPNPAADAIRIEFRKIETNRSSQVVILDISGKVVLTMTTDGDFIDADIHSLPAGAYVVKVKERNRVMVGRFIRE